MDRRCPPKGALSWGTSISEVFIGFDEVLQLLLSCLSPNEPLGHSANYGRQQARFELRSFCVCCVGGFNTFKNSRAVTRSPKFTRKMEGAQETSGGKGGEAAL